MTREQIIDFLKQHKQEMHDRFGVTKIGLFGSYARGENRQLAGLAQRWQGYNRLSESALSEATELVNLQF